MSVRFDCPSCKANYEVVDDLAGKMIMCRVCKKRGPVRSQAMAQATATKTLSAASVAAAGEATRRDFVLWVGGGFASLGAIGVGALLARQPWRRWRQRPTDQFRFRRGPQTEDGKQDDKGGGQDGKQENKGGSP